MKKRVLSWLLAAVMLLSMLPVTALAEGTGTDVHVTLVDQTGEIVVAYEAVTAEDQNANGTMDIDDVLYAAHETFYEGGAAAGYSTSDGGYGLSISMLWGDTSGSYGYYVNNASAWSLLDEVSAGSHVVAFVYQDTAGWSDVYSYFDRDTAEVETGEALELNLSYQYWDFDMADYGSAAVSGAVITVDGEAQDVTTDENGNAVLTFDTAGTYLVSAFSDAQLLVPPVCMVTVGEAEPEVQPTTIYTGSSKPHSVFGYVSSITVHDVQVEEYLWVGDTAYVTLAPETADDAAARITFTTGGSRAPSMPDTSVTLSGGRAEQSFSASASIFGTWNFTIRLSNQGFPPVLADGVLAETEVTAYVDDPYTLDLSTIFTDETGKTLTHYVQEDGGSYTQLSGSVYTMTPGETGTRTLTFKASNGLDSKTYTVHMTVKEMTYYDMTVQVPENISPVFYGTEGYNADGVDVPGDALTAAGSAAVEGLCTYTVTVPEKYDTISVRADGWGGMSVEAGAGSTVTLRRMEGTLAADVTGEEIDGTVQVTYDGHTAEAGEGSRYLLAVGKSYT